MKKTLPVMLAVMFVLVFVATGFAAEKAGMQKSVKLTGEVVKNDGKEMVVKGPSGEQTFKVAGVKNVTKYKPGDQVTISYKEKDGKLTASSISKSMIKGKEKEETTKEKEPPK